MQTVTLIGAEEVSRASRNMTYAAEQMNKAAQELESALERHQQFMDNWLIRFEQAMNKQS